jgi:hypothetical protein
MTMATVSRNDQRLSHAVQLIEPICRIAGSWTLLNDVSQDFGRRGLLKAIENHDTGRLFEWLMEVFSFQGISDQVAATYLRKNGSVSWEGISSGLASRATCPRLHTYWAFDRCGYDKGSRCCAEPEHIDACPLPGHKLRNGRLNQTAYSLFLFIRDIARNDLVEWIETRIAQSPDPGTASEALIGPLRHIFGVSDKVLTMSLSTLLMGARQIRPAWFAVGSHMIAVDTLVHNFLHRTGLLSRFEAEHAYGPRCYAPGGCAEIIRLAAADIDARRFNAVYPADFPRFVQHAIWRFCAADEFDTCNGNMIDDTKPCQNAFCTLFKKCDHITLRSENKRIKSDI